MTEEYEGLKVAQQEYENLLKSFRDTPDNDPDEDVVNHPSHYMSYYKDSVDCLTAMESAFGKAMVAHFCLGNCWKYLWRHSSKGGMQDIEKALFYLNKYKEIGIIDLGA